MSLVNDALKRAKRTEPKNLAPADGPSLFPVEGARRSGGTDFLMTGLVAVILLLAGLLLWQWARGDGGVAKVRANTISPAVKPVDPVAIKQTSPTPAPTAIAVATPVATAPIPAAIAPPPVQPAPITYRLQSIFYFSKNPTAIINGKTVSVGSHIGDARVLAIGADSATLVTATGQTNVLELP